MKNSQNNKKRKMRNPAIDFQFFAINNPNKKYDFADKRAKILYNELSNGCSWAKIAQRHNTTRNSLYNIARIALRDILRDTASNRMFEEAHKILETYENP